MAIAGPSTYTRGSLNSLIHRPTSSLKIELALFIKHECSHGRDGFGHGKESPDGVIGYVEGSFAVR